MLTVTRLDQLPCPYPAEFSYDYSYWRKNTFAKTFLSKMWETEAIVEVYQTRERLECPTKAVMNLSENNFLILMKSGKWIMLSASDDSWLQLHAAPQFL